MIGTAIKHDAVESLLAKGGMGVVYRAGVDGDVVCLARVSARAPRTDVVCPSRTT